MHKFAGTTCSRLASYRSLSFKKFENGQKIVRSKGCDKKPLSRSLQEKIVEALFLGERSRASSLLLELGCGRSTLNANDFLYILQRCARLPDPLFLMETWKLMEEKEIEISKECYMFAIQALSRGGYLNEAFNLLNIVRDNPDTYYFLPIYNIFLGACFQMHSRPYVNRCLDLMDHEMVGKDEITYYQLLKLAVLQQNLAVVHEIWRECTMHYNPSILCLRKFIWAFSKLRDLESAHSILQQMVDVASLEDFIVCKTADGKMRSLRLDIPALCQGDASLLRAATRNGSHSEHCSNVGTIKKHVSDISKSTIIIQKRIAAMKLLRWSFSDVIHACAVMQNDILAEKLLNQNLCKNIVCLYSCSWSDHIYSLCRRSRHVLTELTHFGQMQNLGLKPSRQAYNAFTMAVLSVRGVHDAIEVLKLMEKKNMMPYDSTLVCLSVSCSRILELDLAEHFLDQVSSFEGPYPFNALLEACNFMDLPERAIQTLAMMKKLNIQPDIRTYELLFSQFGCGDTPYTDDSLMFQNDVSKRIHAIDMDMMKNGIHHSQLSMMNLLKALGAMGRVQEMIQYLHAAENQFPHYQTCLETCHYNTVLHFLVRAKEISITIAIFKGMISCGIPCDAATYTIMVDCCTIMNDFRSASSLVSMMIRDGFIPQIYIYTSFIKILVASEEFGEAFKLLKKAISHGIQPDALLYNRIVQKASEKGRIDLIEIVVEQMHRDRVQPNSSICRNIFLAYVDSGFYKTAMEALQVLCMRMISLEESVLEERRAEYEHLVLNEEEEEVEDYERKIIEPLFEKESSSRDDHLVAMLLLRWCAMLGFPISWLPDRSPWAKRLSLDYDLSTQA